MYPLPEPTTLDTIISMSALYGFGVLFVVGLISLMVFFIEESGCG
jgi:hypothetical protein